MLVMGAFGQTQPKVHKMRKKSVCFQIYFFQFQHRLWLIYKNHTT